jgi:translation initiation factor IF-1
VGVKSVRGRFVEVLPRALYRVAVDGGSEIVANAGTDTRRNFVRLIVGDDVLVELAPRDVTRGRVVSKRQGG